MRKEFVPVSLNQRNEYYSLWTDTPVHSLDYTFANLWGWQTYYGLEWLFEDDICWIRQTNPELIYWAPLGNWQKIDWRAKLKDFSDNKDCHFHRVPEGLLNIWLATLPEKIDSDDERGQWEYLYSQEELATLPGNRFHKKKNHYNSFVKAYGEPDYQIIDKTRIEAVLELQNDWCHWHECLDSPSLTAENQAVNHVLENWDIFPNLVGGSLFVDGKMVAFSVGEALDQNNLGVHFEKALNGYKGIYQAINLEFAKNAGNGFKWINRAQDLDEDGMRQAKMTYQPAGFLKKFEVTVKI